MGASKDVASWTLYGCDAGAARGALLDVRGLAFVLDAIVLRGFTFGALESSLATSGSFLQ